MSLACWLALSRKGTGTLLNQPSPLWAPDPPAPGGRGEEGAFSEARPCQAGTPMPDTVFSGSQGFRGARTSQAESPCGAGPRPRRPRSRHFQGFLGLSKDSAPCVLQGPSAGPALKASFSFIQAPTSPR